MVDFVLLLCAHFQLYHKVTELFAPGFSQMDTRETFQLHLAFMVVTHKQARSCCL